MKRIISILLSVVLLFCCLSFSASAEEKAAVIYNLKDANTATFVRSGPGTTHDRLRHQDNDIRLFNGQELTVLQTVDCDDSSAETHPTWHRVRFSYSGDSYTGYVSAEFVKIKEQTGEITKDFEEMIKDFPEDYQVKLRELHLYYPEWKFVPVPISMTWEHVIENEFVPNLNFIHGTDPYSWRSTAPGSYDWTEDTWMAYTGSRYDASKEIIEYFMDPRNFLDEVHIFQFESLNYDSDIHTLDGVKKILEGTFMEGKKIKNLSGKKVTYAQAYIDAAEYSGASPYHLAARTKQEVGPNGSNSTSGKVEKYEGIYNFYNIQASPSAVNGLIWAKREGDYGRPWDTQYKSIYNGGKWIADGYINRGQDTLYFQKFSVVRENYFTHQYMQTLSAPYSESSTIYSNYSGMELLNSPFIFRIPVYKDMPKEACPKPTGTGSPNNWLKTLSVEGHSLTPTFECDGTDKYSLIVENNISSINIDCTAVSKKAVIDGEMPRTVSLEEGANYLHIKVTAANGDVKYYTLTVVRKLADGSVPEIDEDDIPVPDDSSSSSQGAETSSKPNEDPSSDPSGGSSSKPDEGTSSKPEESSSSKPPVIPSGHKIAYSVNGKTISGVKPGTKLDAAEKKLRLYGKATAEFYSKDGKKIKSGVITTGTKVKISYSGKTDTFTFIVRGDANGDGVIDAIDLLMIRRYMLSTYDLKDEYLAAADCNKDGAADAIDLLMVRRNLLGTYTIEQ